MIHFLDDLAYNDPAVISLEDQKVAQPHYQEIKNLLISCAVLSNTNIELNVSCVRRLLINRVLREMDFILIQTKLVLAQQFAMNRLRSKTLQTFVRVIHKKLREVAKLLQNYSRFQNVGISFSEIYQRKEQITNLLHTNSIAACYWWGVVPISGQTGVLL